MLCEHELLAFDLEAPKYNGGEKRNKRRGSKIPYSGKLSRICARSFSSRTSRARATYIGIVCIHESFLREIVVLVVFVKVFSLESFPLYGNSVPGFERAAFCIRVQIHTSQLQGRC